MKKPSAFVLLLFFTFFQSLKAQDIIVKENGEEIKSRVVEVGKKEIRYKNFDDPDFATYSIKKEQVKKIKFENGTEKPFPKYAKSYISLMYGSTDPVGYFGKNDTRTSLSGYAKHGMQGNLEAGIYLKKNFGFAVTFGNMDSQQDTSALKIPYQGNSNIQLRFNTDPRWNIGYFLIGPLYSFQLGKKFIIDTRLMAGPMIGGRPGMGISYHNPTTFVNTDYYYQDASGHDLGICVGGGIRWAVTKRFALRFSIDLLHTKVRLKYNVQINTFGPSPGSNTSYTENDSDIQRISVFRTGIGIAYLIKRK